MKLRSWRSSGLRSGTSATLARYLAAAAAVGAGIIHLRVTPAHFAESFLFGAFMLTVGLAQLLAAVWLLIRPSRPLVVAIILCTVPIFAVFAVAYTVGLPVGPDPGEPERLGTLVVLSKLVELVLLFASTYLVTPARQAQHRLPGITSRR